MPSESFTTRYLPGTHFAANYCSRVADTDEMKSYEVSPLGLVARGNLLYLVCTFWDYQEIRQLALHRVLNATMTDKTVTRPEGFDLDKYIEQGEFQYSVGPMIQLKLKMERGGAAHLYETPLSEDQKIEDLGADHVIVTAMVRDTAQTAVVDSRIRRVGGQIRAAIGPIPLTFAGRMIVMPIPEVIRAAVIRFHEEWRHPRLPNPELSEVYALFPDETRATPTTLNWPDDWPLAARSGVYLIFDEKMELLYVGKAGGLGDRLCDYFKYQDRNRGPCRIVHQWKARPMFVATISVSESFEAPALEEFLIRGLRPSENKLLVAPP